MIVCLGNPGLNYVRTRHNIGFMAGDVLVGDMVGVQRQEKFHSLCVSGTFVGHPVRVLFPQTYMNLSGKAVTAAMAFYKTPPENMLVVYDDLDIDFGRLRFREKGSAGTHNGMRSVVGAIGSGFPRLRLGIGPKPQERDTAQFVLDVFTPSEEKILKTVCQGASQTIGLWLTEGRDAATRFAASLVLG